MSREKEKIARKEAPVKVNIKEEVEQKRKALNDAV